MFSYHSGALPGSTANAATSSRGRAITRSTLTSTTGEHPAPEVVQAPAPAVGMHVAVVLVREAGVVELDARAVTVGVELDRHDGLGRHPLPAPGVDEPPRPLHGRVLAGHRPRLARRRVGH